MKYTIAEYNDGTEAVVFTGTEHEVFEHLQDSGYYTFLDESEEYGDRMEYAEYRLSLECKNIEDVYCPDYSWYKLEVTDESGRVVNQTENPGNIYAVVESKNGRKDAVCIGTKRKVGDFLKENAYDLYCKNLEYEDDPERMKELIRDFDDTDEILQENMQDGMTEDEALEDAYKTYVDSALRYIKESVDECKRKKESGLNIKLGFYRFYGLEVERR